MINKETDKRISDYLLGNLSEQEKQKITSGIDKDFLNDILEADDITERYESYATADTEKALRRALDIAYPPHYSYGWRIAAVMLCLLATGAFFWYKDYSRVMPPEIGQEVESLMVKALESQRVSTGVTATPSDEETAYIEQLTPDYLSTFQLDAGKAEEMLQAENITTYHNKEHWLTLDDGTIVHLDANSRIIYPEHFSRFGTREVVLDGNAYFMVAHDRSRRFVVHTKHGSITDYGTEFYVSTSDETTRIALIEGMVGFTPQGRKQLLLKPGEEVTAISTSVSISDKNMEEYRAWNTGKFFFEDKSLEDIAHVAQRWYSINIVFAADDICNKQFSGAFDRHNDIEDMIDAICYVTGLHWVRKSADTIVISH